MGAASSFKAREGNRARGTRRAVSEIIGQDEDEIGAARARGARERRQQRNDSEEKQGRERFMEIARMKRAFPAKRECTPDRWRA